MSEQVEVIVIIGFVMFSVFAFWRICSKAGFPPALSLLLPIPIVNIALLSILAFTEWPALTRQQQNFDDDNS